MKYETAVILPKQGKKWVIPRPRGRTTMPYCHSYCMAILSHMPPTKNSSNITVCYCIILYKTYRLSPTSYSSGCIAVISVIIVFNHQLYENMELYNLRQKNAGKPYPAVIFNLSPHGESRKQAIQQFICRSINVLRSKFCISRTDDIYD